MAITRTGYMDHEAGEELIGQGYGVSVVEFTEQDGRITVETVWRKPEGVKIELEDLCQCRLNFPQERRLKIPHFVLDQSRP